jgi:hypothetical protein
VITKYTYIFLSCHQNAEENSGINLANRSFEYVAQFKCLEITVTSQNLEFGVTNNQY